MPNILKVLQLFMLIIGPKTVAARCWQVIHDCYNCNICIRFPAHIIALSSLVISYKIEKIPDIPSIEDDEEFLDSRSCSKTLLSGK